MTQLNLLSVEQNLLPVFHSWLNDPIAFGEFDQPHPIQWDEFIKNWEADYYKTTKIIFLSDKPIGWIRFFISERRPWICAISIFITLPEMRGKGYGSMAMQLFMKDIEFRYPEVCKFEVMTDFQNKAAQAMFKKLGFVEEGLFKRYWKLKGQYSDMYSFGLIK